LGPNEHAPIGAHHPLEATDAGQRVLTLLHEGIVDGLGEVVTGRQGGEPLKCCRSDFVRHDLQSKQAKTSQKCSPKKKRRAWFTSTAKFLRKKESRKDFFSTKDVSDARLDFFSRRRSPDIFFCSKKYQWKIENSVMEIF
jgi:hypothetical protein